MASTFLTRTAELRNQGISALDAAKQARAEMATPVATPGAPATKANGLVSSTTTNPDGTVSISASVKPPVASVFTTGTDSLDETIATAQKAPSAVSVPGATAPTPTSSTPSATTSPSANKSVGSTVGGTTGKKDSAGNILDTVTNDATNTYKEDKQINAAQLASDTKTAEDASNAEIAAAEAQRIQKESDAIEENNRQVARANEDAILQRNQDNEYKLKQEANLAALDAKHKQAENALAIANDVALQQSNVAFAKLGLSLSTAGVTTAQQIYTTGIYNLSKLKADDAYDYANLHEQVAKTEFEHTTAVNKIIRDSENKTYTIREKLNNDVYAIKNSIVKSTRDKQLAISALIDKYQKARNDNEEGVIKKMTDASKSISASTEALYTTLKEKEGYANTHIKLLVDSGKWASLPDTKRVALEKQAGIPPGTTTLSNRASLGKLFDSQAEKLTGLKGITFSASEYTQVINDASAFQSMGNGPEESMNKALMAHLKNSPEYQAKLRENAKKGRSGGTGTPKSEYATGQLISFDDPTGVTKDTQTAEYHAGKGDVEGYVVSGGTKIPFSQLKKVTTPKSGGGEE